MYSDEQDDLFLLVRGGDYYCGDAARKCKNKIILTSSGDQEGIQIIPDNWVNKKDTNNPYTTMDLALKECQNIKSTVSSFCCNPLLKKRLFSPNSGVQLAYKYGRKNADKTVELCPPEVYKTCEECNTSNDCINPPFTTTGKECIKNRCNDSGYTYQLDQFDVCMTDSSRSECPSSCNTKFSSVNLDVSKLKKEDINVLMYIGIAIGVIIVILCLYFIFKPKSAQETIPPVKQETITHSPTHPPFIYPSPTQSLSALDVIGIINAMKASESTKAGEVMKQQK